MLRACASRGLQAQLVEASSGPAEVGLGLNLPGNAVRAFRALGIADSLRQRAATVRRREYRNARGRLIFAVDEAAYWGEADTPICARRGDVLDLLRAGADPGRVRFGSTVTGVAETDGKVQVTFADSATESYDLVVGADGVHSRVRTSLLGAAATRESLLSSASWRFVTVDPGVQCWSVWSGAAGTLLLIPLVGDQVYGYASATAGGSVGDDPQWLRSTFSDYPTLAREAISSALAEPSSLYHSPIEEVRLESWPRGRVVLIGDAAHATAPVWAQGAAQAAEDALVLAELLASGQDWATVGAEFERRRRDRVEHVQRMTDRLSKAAALPGWFRDAILPVIGPRTYRATFDPLKDAVIEPRSLLTVRIDQRCSRRSDRRPMTDARVRPQRTDLPARTSVAYRRSMGDVVPFRRRPERGPAPARRGSGQSGSEQPGSVRPGWQEPGGVRPAGGRPERSPRHEPLWRELVGAGSPRSAHRPLGDPADGRRPGRHLGAVPVRDRARSQGAVVGDAGRGRWRPGPDSRRPHPGGRASAGPDQRPTDRTGRPCRLITLAA